MRLLNVEPHEGIDLESTGSIFIYESGPTTKKQSIKQAGLLWDSI